MFSSACFVVLNQNAMDVVFSQSPLQSMSLYSGTRSNRGFVGPDSAVTDNEWANLFLVILLALLPARRLAPLLVLESAKDTTGP